MWEGISQELDWNMRLEGFRLDQPSGPKEASMRSRAHRLVADALASHLELDPSAVRGSHLLQLDLGIDPLDLVLVVLKLEADEPWRPEFPFSELEHARTVDDFVDLVESWQERDTLIEPEPSSASFGDH
jgi:acyl carrier protein